MQTSMDPGALLAPPAPVAPPARVLVFQGDSPAAAEAFARADAYLTNGLVTRWRVRKWNTVVGEGRANPVRPEDL